MQHGSTRARRLIQLEHLLLAHPEGLTPAEAARRLNVHRSTAGRDLADLSVDLPIYENDSGRMAIDRDIYLNDIRLTLHEILALHLASRLLADHSDRHNPHAAAAVRKLGHAVALIAPRIAEVLDANADILDDDDTRRDGHFLGVLERLTRAWADGRSIDLRYRSASSGEEHPYRMDIYYIRPYAAGHTLHVIGQCDGDDHLRTLRVDRVVEATPTDRTYRIPDDLDLQAMLRGAWGVWYGEQPKEVVLRFTARAAARVRESRWHAGEHTRDLPDGRLEWRTRVAEPREMYPWIRGWGADVEIVEPKWLREEFKGELGEMCRVYGVEGVARHDGECGAARDREQNQ